MRTSVLSLSLLVTCYLATAEEMSLPMQTFVQGCELLVSALESKSLADLADAQLLLSIPVIERMDDVEPVSSESRNNLGNPWIAFTSGFAEELVTSGNLSDFTELQHPYLGHKGTEELYVWHASIKAHSSATMRTTSEGFSELLLFSTKNSNLSIDVWVSGLTDDIYRIEGDDLPFTYLSWNMVDGEYEFTVTNNSDEAQTFVIAVNAE